MNEVVETPRQKAWRECNRILTARGHRPATIGEFTQAREPGEAPEATVAKIAMARFKENQ